jgi:uncharacterized membrane protein YheB (UPF0754 family)
MEDKLIDQLSDEIDKFVFETTTKMNVPVGVVIAVIVARLTRLSIELKNESEFLSILDEAQKSVFALIDVDSDTLH